MTRPDLSRFTLNAKEELGRKTDPEFRRGGVKRRVVSDDELVSVPKIEMDSHNFFARITGAHDDNPLLVLKARGEGRRARNGDTFGTSMDCLRVSPRREGGFAIWTDNVAHKGRWEGFNNKNRFSPAKDTGFFRSFNRPNPTAAEIHLRNAEGKLLIGREGRGRGALEVDFSMIHVDELLFVFGQSIIHALGLDTRRLYQDRMLFFGDNIRFNEGVSELTKVLNASGVAAHSFVLYRRDKRQES